MAVLNTFMAPTLAWFRLTTSKMNTWPIRTRSFVSDESRATVEFVGMLLPTATLLSPTMVRRGSFVIVTY